MNPVTAKESFLNQCEDAGIIDESGLFEHEGETYWVEVRLFKGTAGGYTPPARRPYVPTWRERIAE